MSSWQGGVGVPHTVVDGEVKVLTGLNRLVLMQVMQDKGWTDSRFYTSDQIAQAGWVLRDASNPVSLEFLVSVDRDGVILSDPIVKRFLVFNANDIQGVGRPLISLSLALEDVTIALDSVGIDVVEDGVCTALEAWAWLLLGERGIVRSEVGKADFIRDALIVRLATSLVLSEIGLPVEMTKSDEYALPWVHQIDVDPLSFCNSVNLAQLLASDMSLGIRSVALERSTSANLVEVRTSSSFASARVKELFSDGGAVVLSVPFAQKDLAKKLGAVWYGPKSVWFVPKGVDVAAFSRWLPNSQMSLNPNATREVLLDSFRDEMLSMGLIDPGEIVDDGAWHNVGVTTKQGRNKSGSYILNLSGGHYGQPIGTIMNKHTGQSHTWTHVGASLTPEQRARSRAESLARESLVAAQALKVQDVAAQHAVEIWSAAGPADGHGYVLKKGISPEGLRQVMGSSLLAFSEFVGESGGSAIRANEKYLLVPMSDTGGRLRAVQVISDDGLVKLFMRGAQKKGLMAVLGAESFNNLLDSGLAELVAFGEGIATMASFREVSRLPVVVCFDAGNLEFVASSLIPLMPAHVAPILALDNDQFFLERALGFAIDQVGVNPVLALPGSVHQVVVDGVSAVREIELGSFVIDGQWHQASGGKFCAKCELDGVAVRSVSVDTVPSPDGRKLSAVFANRGLEAGQKILTLCANAREPHSVFLASPVFASLEGRPTDWNDLVQREGLDAARGKLSEVLRMGLLWTRMVAVGRSSVSSDIASRSGSVCSR